MAAEPGTTVEMRDEFHALNTLETRRAWEGDYGRRKRFWGWVRFRFSRVHGQSAVEVFKAIGFWVGASVQLIAPILLLIKIGLLDQSAEEAAQKGDQVAVAHVNRNAYSPATSLLITLAVAQAIGSIMIGWYKSRGGRALSPSAMQRRADMAHAMDELPQGQSIPQDKARLLLRDVLHAVRLDLQEFLGVGEHDVAVVCFGVDSGEVSSGLPEGRMIHLQRDRASVDAAECSVYVRECRTSYVYDAYRLKRAIYFPDLTLESFKSTFPDKDRNYRSVLAVPATAGSRTLGVVAVNCKHAYCLSVDEFEHEKRLRPFMKLAGRILHHTTFEVPEEDSR